MQLISPNEILEAAKKEMLNGREPKSRDEWILVMNFMAVNCHLGCRLSCCKLLGKIYDMPLSESDIKEIVEFQSPFAVVISLLSGAYYVKEKAEGQIFGHGLNMSTSPGVKDINPSWYVAGKFETRKEAEDFRQVCIRRPDRQKIFQELIADYG